MKSNKKKDQNFRSVEFMRKVRNDLTIQFHKDREKYLAYLKQVLEDFKLQQKENSV